MQAAQPHSALSQIEIDALGWLQGLIRIDTTNPPGNELVAAKYIAAILHKRRHPVRNLSKARPAADFSSRGFPPAPCRIHRAPCC